MANDLRRRTEGGRWSEHCRAFVDDNGAVLETEQEIEARGPRPRERAEQSPRIDGYVWTGTHYERIGPGPDFRDVWQAGLRAVVALRKRGEW